jgi:hypothetical protein
MRIWLSGPRLFNGPWHKLRAAGPHPAARTPSMTVEKPSRRNIRLVPRATRSAVRDWWASCGASGSSNPCIMVFRPEVRQQHWRKKPARAISGQTLSVLRGNLTKNVSREHFGKIGGRNRTEPRIM